MSFVDYNINNDMKVCIPEQSKMKAAMAQCPEIHLVVLFGSAVTGRIRKESDIDIGVLAEPEALKGQHKLFSKAVKALVPFFPSHLMDIVILNDAGSVLNFQVAKFGKPVYEKNEGAMKRFVMKAARDYQDSEYRRKVMTDRRIARIKQGVPDGKSGNLLEAARCVARLLNES